VATILMISRNGIARWWSDNFRRWNARHRLRNAVQAECNHCGKGCEDGLSSSLEKNIYGIPFTYNN